MTARVAAKSIPVTLAIRLSICVALLVVTVCAPVAHAQEVNPVQPAGVKYLEDPMACVRLATGVGDEVLSHAKKTKRGITFGEGPSVYSGDAGVALLFMGLYRATRAKKWLDATRATLAEAVAAPSKGNGLYTGRAGVGEACLEAYAATGEKEFLVLARTCAKDLGAHTATDIISGAAGELVFLLNLHGFTDDEADLAAARRVGDYLLAAAVKKEGSAHWPVVANTRSKVYVGFSHGAAGIGDVLLHLWRRTGEEKYRDSAEQAARFVLAHEIRVGDEGAHWWRTVPKSSDQRRIQWCHGAPGTGLFFHALHRYVPTKSYADALARCLETTSKLGRTARVGGCQCHGVTGNAELFLEIVATDPDDVGSARWLREARRSGSALLERPPKNEQDAFVVRLRLGGRAYDHSYMLGLAGIGHFFLRLADPKNTPLPMMVR